MKKFWKWKNRTVLNQETQEPIQERTLFLNGTIAEESWFDDDVTPQVFKEELCSGSGDITVWINSPGGDCVAAAQIYNMLMDYPGLSQFSDVGEISRFAQPAFAWAHQKGYITAVEGDVLAPQSAAGQELAETMLKELAVQK